MNVYFQEDAKDNVFLPNRRQIRKRTLAATGFSGPTVDSILSQKTKYPRQREPETRERPSTIPDYYVALCTICMEEMWRRKQKPSVAKLMAMLGKRVDWKGWSASTLCRFLHRNGFQYAVKDRYDFLRERSDIIAQRDIYLDKIHSLRSHCLLVYYDETSLTEIDTPRKQWLLHDRTGGLPVINKRFPGRTRMFCHAGSIHGFIPAALLELGMNESLDGPGFLKYVKDRLIPTVLAEAQRLGQRPVLILDRATPHRVITEESKPVWKITAKEKIVDFLMKHHVRMPDTPIYHQRMERRGKAFPILEPSRGEWLVHNQTTLYRTAKDSSIKPVFQVEVLFAENGIEVLWTPTAHPFLSLIEFVWGWAKDRVIDTGMVKFNDRLDFFRKLLSRRNERVWGSNFSNRLLKWENKFSTSDVDADLDDRAFEKEVVDDEI